MDTDNRRVAIVTGANRGLGREIGRRLAGLGITVALAGRDHGRLEEAAGSIVGADPAASIFPLVLDVRDRSAIGPAVGGVLDRCGRIDILVNNAGILVDGEEGMASVTDRPLCPGSRETSAIPALPMTRWIRRPTDSRRAR